MDEDRQLILQVFETQCEDGFARMEESLLRLEAHPEDDEALNTIFRICHTLKGDSDIMGFPEIAELAHVLEDLLEPIRSGSLMVGEALISLLLEARDALEKLARHAIDDAPRDAIPDFSGLIARLGEYAGTRADSTPRASAPEPHGTDEANERVAERAESPDGARRSQSIRVHLDTLDRLVDMTGELAIGRSRLTQLLNHSDSSLHVELREAHHALDQLFTDLQEEVMRVRMVPVGPVFRQHLRTVRDVALNQGKRAHLEMEGEEVELDTTVVEHLRDCLGHLIRNSLTHGLESPNERERAGKPAYGTIRLAARHEGANIVVEVRDDGTGMDTARILARARAVKLVSETESLSDLEIHRLIFQPGFSTAESTTRVAGRGVGMDVVKRKIDSLGGTISLRSSSGQGTSIQLSLPLTLAIVEGFSVRVGDQIHVVPLNCVVECIDLPATASDSTDGTGLLSLRGVSLPWVRLGELLGRRGHAGPTDRESVVVLKHREAEIGLVVDELLGETQAVIKPLGGLFRELPGISGATILGDGRVALILEISALLERALPQHQLDNSARWFVPESARSPSDIRSTDATTS